jgi:hypothetical protein
MRKLRFDGNIAQPERVIFRIRNQRRILAVIALVVLSDLGGEARELGGGLGVGEGGYGSVGG